MAQNIKFERLGVMVDCSRNAVMTVPAFKQMVDIVSSLGYTTIRLYIEDTYEVDKEYWFGIHRGRYTRDELREMDDYAASKGMELIPHIQTLAHLGTIFRYAEYIPVNDVDDILLVGEDRTYELIDNMFRSLVESFRTRTVHLGMDEAFKIGRGKYMDKHGYEPIHTIISRHLKRVLEIAKKYDLQCEMWGDMFIRAAYGDVATFTKDDAETVKKEVPENLQLVCWDYYHTDAEWYKDMIEKYYKLTKNVCFASGAWSWLGFCPNNSYSIKECEANIKACVEKKIKDYFVTIWGDNGGEGSYFGVLPTLYAISEFAKGNFDMPSIKEGFKQKFDIDFDLFCTLELPDRIQSVEGELDTYNPSKVQLYSAPFNGVFDQLITESESNRKFFADASAKIREGESHPVWGRLFKTIRCLADVLEIKFDLGLKTRRIYKSGNMDEMRKLADEDYQILVDRLRTFYDSYERFWLMEKKPHGFDVQVERMGGLVNRVDLCRRRIVDYVDGKVPNIPELEEELREPLCYAGLKGISLQLHNLIYTVNVT